MGARTLGFCLTLAVGGAVAAGEGPIVRNGGFDDVAADGTTIGWTPRGAHYVYRDGEGRSGTRALCFTNDDPSFYSFPSQILDVKPGRSYEYEVWVRTENLVGDESGATVCVEWNGANGRWLGGSYVDGVKGTKDWTRIHGITPALPAEAREVRICPYVRRGMTGRAWFDDLAVREHQVEPIAAFGSTAYRNAAAAGKVTFRVGYGPSSVLEQPGLSLWFHYQDAQGAAARVQATNAVRDSVTLPVAALKKGAQEVKSELLDPDGKVLGSRTLAFTRLEKEAKRTVGFDSDGRTLVNGQPFFPLGMYWHAITTNKIETYAKGPFNCLMPYAAPKSRDLMDLCDAHDLKVIYSVKDVFAGTRWAPAGVTNEVAETRYVEDCVARFKDHPALLAWYLNDELPVTMLPRLVARRDLMERLDPDHPGWVVLYQYTQIQEYFSSFDVVGTDPYPIPDKPAAMASDWTRATMRGTLGCKPVWQVPQAFNWAAYKKGDDRKKFRAPTEAELRSMCWQCIADGANGLILYSYFDLEKQPNGESFEKRWAECCRVGAEIRAMFPVLLARPGGTNSRILSISYSALPDDAATPKRPFPARTWEKDGDTYLLVVNTGAFASEICVRLATPYAKATSIFGHKPLLTSDSAKASSRVNIDLDPFEPAMVKLEK